jgi:hypothetical protein
MWVCILKLEDEENVDATSDIVIALKGVIVKQNWRSMPPR